jgi:hypothetical protein
MLRETGDAFAHACAIAAEEGAGTLVAGGRFDLVDCAVVLEPEEPLAAARRVLYAGMSALADALAVHAPPEKLIAFAWPDAVLVDGGLVGGGRIAWPEHAPDTKPPAWLVFGFTVRAVTMAPGEPGVHPDAASLEDEGFDTAAHGLIETFARHFLAVTDLLGDEGFVPVMRSYLQRLPAASGEERTIDGAGNLLVRRKGKARVEKRALLPALALCAWRDPQTGEPRL